MVKVKKIFAVSICLLLSGSISGCNRNTPAISDSSYSLSSPIVSASSASETGSENISTSSGSESMSTNTISFSMSDLEGKSVFEFMDENGITTLNTDETNTGNAALFQLGFKEMQGEYYSNVLFQKIMEGKSYAPVEAVVVEYFDDERGYAWFYTDGVQDWRVYDSFNQIRKMDQNGHYCLELDDEANNSYFHIGENDDYMPCPVIFTVWDNKVTEINVGSNSLYYKTNFNIENYINSHYLEGTYKDSKGVTYTFASEMQAKWGDRTFEYVLFDWKYEDSFGEWGGYNPLCVIDPVTKKATWEYYAYQRVDNRLYIYKAELMDMMIVFAVEEQPFLVLDKVD